MGSVVRPKPNTEAAAALESAEPHAAFVMADLALVHPRRDFDDSSLTVAIGASNSAGELLCAAAGAALSAIHASPRAAFTAVCVSTTM